MGERLALLGGKLKIESRPGAGTTIVAEVPWHERDADPRPDRRRPRCRPKRTALRARLRRDIEVVGEAGDSQHAVFETRAQKPDVILMDVVMPGKSGIEATPDVLKDAPDAKVLILSMQDDPTTCARLRRRRHRIHPQRGRRHRPRRGGAGGRRRRAATSIQPWARMVAADAEERQAGRRRPAFGPRARGPAPAGTRPHQPGDRGDALHLGPHGRDASRAHHAEAPPATRAELVRYALEHGMLEVEDDT